MSRTVCRPTFPSLAKADDCRHYSQSGKNSRTISSCFFELESEGTHKSSPVKPAAVTVSKCEEGRGLRAHHEADMGLKHADRRNTYSRFIVGTIVVHYITLENHGAGLREG